MIMSASSKFDIASASQDRPLYGSGHRGSYGAASLERSCSYRESMENQFMSSLPSKTRSTSSVTEEDVLNFFQCLRSKSVVIDHKLNRPVDIKQIASAAFGIQMEDSLPTSLKNKQLSISSPEDLQQLKSGVRDIATKARERVKILNDCLSEFTKCFPTILSRKRSRLDASSNERSYTLLPIDRSATGTGKIDSENHASTGGAELEQQKSEGRIKNVIPNKRPRTSVIDSRMDGRANTPARLSGTTDQKDRVVVRLPNSSIVQGDDRTLSIPVNGWEKTKTKKKRTGIKLDMAANSVETKPLDGYRESRQGSQPRLPSEAHSRLNDSHGFRSGSSGGASARKAETTSQTSLGLRFYLPKTDSENSSLLHERRECAVGQEEERVILNSVNKAHSREDFSSGSPTSRSKLNTNVGGPRSTASGVSKLSQGVSRSTPSNDWELLNCTSILPGIPGANNRKRAPSAKSSSPPVDNWGQRPQKSSRTARRTNLLPSAPSNEKNSVQDTTPSMMANERILAAPSPQEAKIKAENFSPPALSESEESGAMEVKLRIKSEKCNKMDEKSGQDLKKRSTLLLPSKKNKILSGDSHGDGVKRQGRTGRGFSSSRSLLPSTVEKLRNVGTTKQIRSSRLGFDKTARAGRPPSRKLPDRKAYTRHKHVAINIPTNFLVGSDDGHNELMAAANAVTNTAQALSSPFWKKVETLFRFISDKDISCLKDQTNLGFAVNTPAPESLDTDSSTLLLNGCSLNEFGSEGSETRSVELSSEHLTSGTKAPNEISLYQRLMASFIPEEENPQFLYYKIDDKYDVYGSPFVQKDAEADAISSYDHLQNDLLSDQVMPGLACSDYQYHRMSINERLLLEVKSIGIYPDLELDLSQNGDEELQGNIIKLDEKYQEQVSRNKSLLNKLLVSVSEAKELREKEFEGRALEKLVDMAYDKYMSCWGPNVHGMKSASGKMARQAALAFVRRALERIREFEVTGRSCFSEPLYKDIFLSGVSRLTEGQALNSNTDDGSGKLHLSTSGCSTEVRTSAPVGTNQSPSNDQEAYSSNPLLVSGFEQNLVKGDTSRTTKPGRPTSVTIKGERKSKAKPKQKTEHPTASVTGPSNNLPEKPKDVLSSTLKLSNIKASDVEKDKNDYNMDILEEPINLSGLQLPDMLDLGVTDVLGNNQGDDFANWLDFVDDGLEEEDLDFMGGLQIPMDNLTDII